LRLTTEKNKTKVRWDCGEKRNKKRRAFRRYILWWNGNAGHQKIPQDERSLIYDWLKEPMEKVVKSSSNWSSAGLRAQKKKRGEIHRKKNQFPSNKCLHIKGKEEQFPRGGGRTRRNL